APLGPSMPGPRARGEQPRLHPGARFRDGRWETRAAPRGTVLRGPRGVLHGGVPLPGGLAPGLLGALLPRAGVSAPLERLHDTCGGSAALRRRLTTQRLRLRHGAAFDALWCRFVQRVLLPHLGEEWVLFERSPNLRLHFARQKAPVSAHCDSEHFHSPFEINFWVPLVDILDGSESLWAESAPGAGDFRPFVAPYGEAVRFYGNKATHFTVPVGRRVDGLQFLTAGPQRFTVFGYYGVVCAAGE
ncbi:unnamed protein product, partial [Prorocentrum cordatum]